MGEALSEEELRGLEGQPDPLYSYAILRRAAAEIRSARATLSRQAELLAAARDALEPLRQIRMLDELSFEAANWPDKTQISINCVLGDARTASTTYDAIREELGNAK